MTTLVNYLPSICSIARVNLTGATLLILESQIRTVKTCEALFGVKPTESRPGGFPHENHPGYHGWKPAMSFKLQDSRQAVGFPVGFPRKPSRAPPFGWLVVWYPCRDWFQGHLLTLLRTPTISEGRTFNQRRPFLATSRILRKHLAWVSRGSWM